ncbi:MAG: class I SAM-dependent methyltransferase [Acidimicrobiales bacterium]
MAHAELDPGEVGLFAYQVFTNLQGAVTAAMIHLGDRLGLYTALAEAEQPLTTAALAEVTGLHERWVREWAYNQGAANVIVVDADERLSLTPVAAAVLADPDHPAYAMGPFSHLPSDLALVDRLPDAFRSGVGLDYDEHGPECAAGIARGFEPWMRTYLLPEVVPQLEGVEARLRDGATLVDVGCGAGGMALLFAQAFPAARVVGYDISHHALALARQRRAAAGVTNVTFLDPRDEPLPTDGSVDVVTTFDCIHDMTDPAAVIGAIRAALVDDGTWLLVDIKAQDTYAENVERNPMASMMYGISVLSCMSSALSEPGGAGLGTLGLSASKAEAMARDAGFTRFRQLEVDHPINAFYEIRP